MAYFARSASLINYIEISRALGINPYVQLNDAGIDRAALLDPDNKIPIPAIARLLEASAKAARVDDFGLRMAETREFSNLGPLSLVARKNPTLRTTLESMAHYLRLQNEAISIRLEEREGIAFIREEIMGGYGCSLSQSMQLTTGVIYRMLSTFLGAAWKPRRVCFVQRQPVHREVFTRLFGTSVVFNQDFDGIACLASDLDVLIPSYDPIMERQTKQYLDTMLARSEAATRDRVKMLIGSLLPSGTCSAEQVAHRLGLQVRTLQRRLRGEAYSSILDAVRAELVIGYIENSERPLSDVASLLGFSSLSAFSRWFGHRFGCSVSRWRRANASGAHLHGPPQTIKKRAACAAPTGAGAGFLTEP